MNSKNGPASEPVIARDATYYRAPDALRERIRASIRAERKHERRPPFWTWGGMAAAVAMASVVSWNVALMQVAGGGEDGLAREIASAHVRSLMAENHLSDVVSTDQHTVKPWFTSHLPVSPRVPDLATQGFVLEGGRVDVVGHDPVATIVYKHAKHTVSVTTLPRGQSVSDQAIAGYNVRSWSDAEFTYIAVSDIPSEDLASFERAFSEGSPAP